MKHFVQALEAEVSRCYKHLRQALLSLPLPDVPQADEWQQAPDGDVQRKRLARQPDKQEQFEQVNDLLAHGL
jgi:hypothetical protein